MSKREFETCKAATCPCGKGQITECSESTDYPFTKYHFSYSLDCPDCQREWHLDHGFLVMKSSESEHKDIQSSYELTRNKLYELSKTLVKIYFEKNLFETKKAELEHLVSLGICCNTSYARYTKYRREGKGIHDIAYGLNNIEYLLAIAEENDLKNELISILNQRDELSKKTEEAYKKIVRKQIKL